MKGVLILDDEEEIRELLEYNLTKHGFTCFLASNGKEGLELLNEHKDKIDLVLLDVMMPIMDGIEVCEIIRKDPVYDGILICFLTARNEDYSQVAGLDAGADDYIAKPLKPKVLISRINALLRRNNGRFRTAELGDSELTVDRDKYVVTLKGESIHLPRKEFELLALLTSKPGNVFDREAILTSVWGVDIVVGDRTIDVHIRKLREKIGSHYIQTVKGVGYKYVDEKLN
ncbi:response regulator transcription factor [Brumimicrobium glaciale]|jgi:two-component system alkaline phosphatase synthesis response regulator PhoP|uniref:Phosphate regulon transcriptional regulatory protein PhoB n=1 Tax=Brumimicrobium glaciale TaxID=200475 RepID=A0A4Q4KRI5_9FLAO|nr:response regulator transcription factor [Brumimicrobium glaciale]RYM35903.1 response regulator transcription factor [Brumimicrobium glaciale]